MKADLAEALWLDSHREISLAELVELSGLSAAELDELADCGAIAPIDPEAAAPRFHAGCVIAARTACRLRDGLELDTQAIAVALALLDRVRELETELRALRALLPRGLDQ